MPQPKAPPKTQNQKCAKKQCQKEAELQTPSSSEHFPSRLNLCVEHTNELVKIVLKKWKRKSKKDLKKWEEEIKSLI